MPAVAIFAGMVIKMGKRPLCLCLFALILWILAGRAADGILPDQKTDPVDPETVLAGNPEVLLSGQILSYKIRENSIQYILGQAVVSFENSLPSKKQSSNISTIKLKKVFCITTDPVSITPGKQAEVCGKLEKIESAGNPGQFDAASYYAVQGITYQIFAESIRETGGKEQKIRAVLYRIRQLCRERLMRSAGEKYGGTLSAVLLGEKSFLNPETKRGYEYGGVLHLLSISGMHVTMLGMCFYRLLLMLRIPEKGAAVMGVVAMAGYTVLTGNGVATMRACLMFSVMLVSRVLKRSYDLLSSLSVAAIFLLLRNPELLFYSGFQLSFAAVIAVGGVLPGLRSSREWSGVKNRRQKIIRGVLKALQADCVVTLFMLPLTMKYFYQIPVYGLVVNLILLPFFGMILGFGAAGCLFGILVERVGKFLLSPAVFLLRIYDLVLESVRHLPGSIYITGVPESWQICVFYLGVLGMMVYWKKRKNRLREQKRIYRWEDGVQVVVIIFITGVLFLRPGTSLSVTVLDVGQGDCIAVRTENGNAYLIDGGSSSVKQVGEYRILPYLRYSGINCLEAVVITHPDQDHINGIQELLNLIAENQTPMQIKRLFMPVWMKNTEEGEVMSKLARRAGARYSYLQKGDHITDGSCHMDILHPDHKDYTEEKNAGSVTIRIWNQSFSGLLTGDLEGKTEVEAVREAESCMFLKAGHHGSAGSTSEAFLDTVKPQICFISCGKNNRYGHPHREMLQRLEKREIRWKSTVSCGALQIYEKNGKIRVRQWRPG